MRVLARIALLGLPLAAAAGVGAAPAAAGQLSYSSQTRPACPPEPVAIGGRRVVCPLTDRYVVLAPSIAYAAAPGEINDVTVTASADGQLQLHDTAGVTLATPTDACQVLDPQTVSCTATAVTGLTLGDGDDTATVAPGVPLRAPVMGQAGDDALTGSSLDGGDGADTLTGTAGADAITAGAGDRVSAGAGDDTIAMTSAGGAVVDGGPGRDTVSYAQTPGPIVARLDGTPETDTLGAIETLVGSPGDDVLTGSDHADRIDGFGGKDTIEGAGGDDVLSEPPTASGSRLSGGPGNDLLVGLGRDDLNDCGPGGGRVALHTPGGNLVSTDTIWPLRTASCRGPAPALLKLAARGRRLSLTGLRCGRGTQQVAGCTFAARLVDRGRTESRGDFSLAPGAARTAHLLLPRGLTSGYRVSVVRSVRFRDRSTVTDRASVTSSHG